MNWDHENNQQIWCNYPSTYLGCTILQLFFSPPPLSYCLLHTCQSSSLTVSLAMMSAHSSSLLGQGLVHLLSRAKMARVGVTNVNVPPWIIGSLQPIKLWRRVTIPETKNMVEMMYPRAGSSSLNQNWSKILFIQYWPHTESRTKYERYGQSSTNHCQEMLEAKKHTHIPGGDIINFVGYPQLFLLFSRIVFNILYNIQNN